VLGIAIPVSELEALIKKSINFELPKNSNYLSTPFDQIIISFDED